MAKSLFLVNAEHKAFWDGEDRPFFMTMS